MVKRLNLVDKGVVILPFPEGFVFEYIQCEVWLFLFILFNPGRGTKVARLFFILVSNM